MQNGCTNVLGAPGQSPEGAVHTPDIPEVGGGHTWGKGTYQPCGRSFPDLPPGMLPLQFFILFAAFLVAFVKPLLKESNSFVEVRFIDGTR
jgi:hypothetical protein